MRKWLLAEFRILDTAKLQMVKRWHPVRCNPGHFLAGDGTRRGFRTRFKHVLKLSTALCLEPVAEQFSRTREGSHQETAKNCADETDRSKSKSQVHGILFCRVGLDSKAISLFISALAL